MRDKIVELTKKFISIPSVSEDIKHANEILKEAKKELKGYTPTYFTFNNHPSLLFGNKEKELRKFKIILNAHLDIQPAAKDQFKPFEKDGKIYGRGAYDMKGAAAVMILLFKEIANKLPYPIGLQLTSDEETDVSTNSTDYQIKQGVRGEFVIMGEANNNLQVGYQAKGRKLIKIHAKGKASHSAYPWLGKNAIWRMYEILEPIVKAFPIAREEIYQTTVNIVKIETDNKSTTMIPENCTAYLDVRFNPKDKNTIVSKIRSLLPKDASIEVDDIRPAHFVDPKNKYISALKQVTKDIHGKNLPLRFAHGAADTIFFSAVGCDAIEFGPIGHGAHHDEEWVDIKSLEDYYNILKNFLLEVDKPLLKDKAYDKLYYT